MLYGTYGLGQDTSELDATGLVPLTGPDQSAPLNVGALSSQISSGGGYSINPTTGQLQSNLVPGVTNSSLLLIVAGLFGLFFFMKGAR